MTNVDPEVLDPVTIQKQLNSNYYFQLVSFSLLFYDYFLTLDWEVARYWGAAQWTWPNIFYFANRYGTLVGNIPVVMQYFWSTPPTARKLMVCKHLESYHQYFIIATQLLVGAMLILRTYALYERNKRVLILMLGFTAGAVAFALWSVITGKSTKGNTNLELYFGCNYPIARGTGLNLVVPWAAVATFDTMIFLLTLGRVLYRRGRPRNGNTMDLLSILLRDGAIYFGVMVMSNLGNILTFALGTPYTRGIATTFTNILSSIMISRLMLNLRDPALAHMSGRGRRRITTSTSRSRTLMMDPNDNTAQGYTTERDSPDFVLDTEYELTTEAPDKPDPYLTTRSSAAARIHVPSRDGV
ncbi:hypothetical protein C8F01DRAFT_1377773 [Mycena amicta]|nr:hypothetical protein C8F01DRAFT_1377773 [Mycena amicta]